MTRFLIICLFLIQTSQAVTRKELEEELNQAYHSWFGGTRKFAERICEKSYLANCTDIITDNLNKTENKDEAVNLLIQVYLKTQEKEPKNEQQNL